MEISTEDNHSEVGHTQTSLNDSIMVNYLVAVDQSSCSQKAFRTTLERVNHVKDDLVIVSVAGDKHLLSLTDMPAVMYINIQETEKKRVKLLLRQYEKLAQKKMVSSFSSSSSD